MKQISTRAERQMQELTFNMFNVRIAIFKGVNDIGLIDVLMRVIAAKDCDIIGRLY